MEELKISFVTKNFELVTNFPNELFVLWKNA